MNFEDIEKKLNNLKADYQITKVPRDLEENGLWEVLGKLEKRKVRFSRRPFWFATLALMAVIVLGLSLGWKSVEAALPGDNLYPIKRFSEKVISQVTGDPQIKVENRANEVVGLVKKGGQDEKALDQATDEYEKEIESVNQNIKPDKRQEFDKKLESHQEEFKQIIKEQPAAGKSLEETVKVTDKIREENQDKTENKEQNKEDKDSKSSSDD